MEELVDCICDYVKKPYTDYAIMINGEWGSGKTYFWNNKLRTRLERIQVAGTEKRYKTIYMSLYGINSLEEISKKIFIETNPNISKSLKKFMNEKEGNSIPEYVKTGLDMANLFGTTNFYNGKIDFSETFSTEDKILCFDDLERANVDVIDILGYINNFVEHDKIKTIVICNEKELATKFKDTNIEMKTMIATYILDKENKLKPEEEGLFHKIDKTDVKPLATMLEEKVSDIFDKANAYERIKEKLIGETFEYIPEYSYILSGMIMKYSYDDELSDFLKRNTSLIISAFNKSSTRNLRILKHSLNDFEKIFTNVKKDYPNLPISILKTMLTFSIAVAFEIKAGNISKEKLKNIKSNNEYNSLIFTSKIVNDNNQFYLREFDNKYFMNNTSSYKFFKFIEVYIRTRCFDEKLYKQNIEEATADIETSKTEKSMKYHSIISGEYLKLSDFDFNVLVMQVIEEIKIGHVDFKEYVKLFSLYKYFINSGLFEMSISELKQAFILGMGLAAQKADEKLLSFEEEIDSEDKDIMEIKKAYNKIKLQILEDISLKKANDLFIHLPNNISEFYRLIMNEFKELPVFAKYDMDAFYAKLEITSNYDLYNLINLFNVRYEDKQELLKLDIKNLKKLCEIIKKNKVGKETTIKLVLLNNIAESIDKLEESLK